LHPETHLNPENPKESHKENKPLQVPKDNSQIVKNKAIRKGPKSHKKPLTHIKEIIAEILPIQKSNRLRKHNHKPEKTEKMQHRKKKTIFRPFRMKKQKGA
jgi:hypothetical protein